MRDFLVEIFLPTFAYFAGVALCIGFVVFASAIATGIVSDPTEIAWEDAQ